MVGRTQKWNKIMVGHKMGTKKEEGGGVGGKGTKGFRARSREVPLPEATVTLA